MKNILNKHIMAYKGRNLYDFDHNILLNWYAQRILEHAKNAKSILELGVGHGITTNLFSKHFDRHVVLDVSLALIENFRNKFPDCKAEIIETYFEEFSTDERFDVIVMGFILEHVYKPSEIINRFTKFLAPNGKLFIAVPNAEALNRRIGHLAGLLADMQKLSENDVRLGHKRYYTVKSLTEEVRTTGYEIDHIKGIYLKPLTTKQIMSLNCDENIIHALCEIGINYPELSCAILAQLKEV